MIKKILTGSLVLTLSFTADASICGKKDDRTPSYQKEIGRTTIGCTATLIGRRTLLTAGHCTDDADFEESYVDFETGLSSTAGEYRAPLSTNRYFVEKASLLSEYRAGSSDFAIFRVQRNKHTGLYPGDIQGFRKVDFSYIPIPGDTYDIIGYGVAKSKILDMAQKSHSGFLIRSDVRVSRLIYRVDTTGGNSGSAVLDAVTGFIVGIHTNGGCNRVVASQHSSGNFGTLISTQKTFAKAIKEYLRVD